MPGQHIVQLSSLILLFATFNSAVALAQAEKETPASPESLIGDEPIANPPNRETFLIDDGLSKPRTNAASESETVAEMTVESRETELQKLLTGARLKGQFTTDGKPLSDLQDETYEIRKIQKLKPDSDTWVIQARIKYGEHDVLVPVPIQIKWAGSTPVLTMENMSVPGLGTFSARVVLHGKRYAGTWQHDAVGGHLFGMILTADDESAATDQPTEKSKPE